MSTAEQARALAAFRPPDWGAVVGRHLLLPEIKGFWPMSGTDSSGNVIDFGNLARTLTNNGATPRAIYGDLVPYSDFTPASSQSLSRASEGGLNGTAAFTLGGWFWTDSIAAGTVGLIGKYTTAGNLRSYLLSRSTATLRGIVSSNGTATTVVDHTTSLTTGSWFHAALRYVPSTSLDIYLNGVKVTNTTSIPASINSNASIFYIGAFEATNFHDGRACLCFLCTDDLPDQMIEELYLSAAPFFR